jgi:hypothetical protein
MMMTVRRGVLVGACLLSALVAGGCGILRQMGGEPMQRDAQVTVAPEELLVHFPGVASSWACSAGPAGGRGYAWTVRMSDGDPWVGIDVRATVPESAPDGGRSPARALEYATTRVARMSGQPPAPVEVLDTTATVFALADSALVMRVTDRGTIRSLTRGRPGTARITACVNGDDAWTREIPVRYDPRF